jgi:hypothetical protein
MKQHPIVTGALAVVFSAATLAPAKAEVSPGRLVAGPRASQMELVQFQGKHWAPDHRRHPRAPRAHVYPGWRGESGWRGAPAWRGPRGWAGRPYWYGRPWAYRPYYGTIIAGVALGTLITVAAVGLVPPRPSPDLCWYWADPYGERGYWDYC